jgi:hypothetical protein
MDRSFPAFEWDEWNVESSYLDIDPDRFARLGRLTFNANLAFSTACGWWIAERFSLLDPSGEAAEFLALSGTSTYERPSYEYFELDEDRWRGPVRGPQAVMLTILGDALYCLSEDPEPATRTAYLHRLANHVITPDGIFDRWFDMSLERMLRHHRRQTPVTPPSVLGLVDTPQWGAPVSQQAFDLDEPYRPQDDLRHIALEASRISPRNRFLPDKEE